MKITILPHAEKELKEIVEYYDDQMPGLGQQFIDHFEIALDMIQTQPFAWRKISKQSRRINIKSFPYLVIYGMYEDEIVISCIAHQHRHPTYYKYR